mgnify:CR=1 FL=1
MFILRFHQEFNIFFAHVRNLGSIKKQEGNFTSCPNLIWSGPLACDRQVTNRVGCVDEASVHPPCYVVLTRQTHLHPGCCRITPT